jgi:hypothetical protein
MPDLLLMIIVIGTIAVALAVDLAVLVSWIAHKRIR